jgi:hypothetical protein
VRVGWKVGLNIAEVEEVMGNEPVFGHLTSATRLEPGSTFHMRGVRAIRAETEVAVELDGDERSTDDPETVRAAVAGLATVLELVDVDPRWMASRGSSRTTCTIGRSLSARRGPSFPGRSLCLPAGSTGRSVLQARRRRTSPRSLWPSRDSWKRLMRAAGGRLGRDLHRSPLIADIDIIG